MTRRDGARRGRLGWPGLVGVVAAWLVLPAFVVRLVLPADQVAGGYATAGSTLASEAAVDVVAVLLVVLVVWRLHWWRQVWVEPRTVNPWVAIVPVTLLVFCAAVTDYSNLATLPVPLLLAFTVSMVTTSASEELLFRGVVLRSLRDRYREGWAVLLMCVLFGALHLVNVVAGAGAVGQALLAMPAGYLLYVCRRVGGGLLLPIVVHAAVDFAVLSGDVGHVRPQDSDAVFYQFLVMLGLVVLLLLARRRIARSPSGSDGRGDASPRT